MVTPPDKKPRAARAAKQPEAGPVLAAVDKLLRAVDLDDMGEANAAIARALASKLDEARASDAGAIAMAIAGIAKELRAVIDAIHDATADTEEFLTDLFSEVGNT